MSTTATAEPPATEPQIDADAMAASILRPSVQKDGKLLVPEPKAPAVAEPAKQVAPMAKVEPVKTEPTGEKPMTDKEKNMAELRKAREAAEAMAKEREAALKEREAELARIREEFETFKKNPIPKDFEEKLTGAEKRAQEFQRELQIAALARDPDFQRKYDAPIKQNLDIISSVMLANGVDKADVQSMIHQWDENRMAEHADTFPAAARLKITAAMMEAIRLDNQKQLEIQNADQTWAELQKQRQQEQERGQTEYLKSLQRDRDSVIQKLTENEAFKADAEMQRQTQEMLDRVIGVNGEKMPASNVLSIMGSTFMAAKQLERTLAEKADMESKLAEAQKTIAEQEAFIKSVQGGIPVPNPTTNAPAAAVDAAFLQSLLRPKVRA